MSKPDDIPQDVWEVARNVYGSLWAQQSNSEIGGTEREEDVIDIARAILAAKAEEREACAKAADNEELTGIPPAHFTQDQVMLVAGTVRAIGASLMNIEWKDATSYSQGERGKIAPRAWESRIEGIRIRVTCGHIYYPGEWIMTNDDLGFDKKSLGLTSEMPLTDVFSKALELSSAEAKRRAHSLIEFARACEAQP